MKLHSFALTDIGRKRQNNQDSFVCNERAKLYVVADGMGGHVAGEVASRLATETMNHLFLAMGHSVDPSLYLVKSIEQANKNIYEKSIQNPSMRGMGTTLTSLYFSYDTVYVAHVGDSRAYFIRDGMIWQLSQDHTLVAEQLVSGMAMPLKNVITRSVGYEREVEIDLYTKKIAPHDYYVLCSDGLYGLIKNHEIATVVSSLSAEVASKKLIDLANSRGGEDNITVLIVKVEGI